MPETVSFNPNKKRIEVRSFGELSKIEWQKTIETIKHISQNENCLDLLIDAADLTSIPEITDVFNIASEDIPQELRIAFHILPSEEIAEKFRLLETVIKNRTIEFKTFDNLEKAEVWLATGKE